MEVYAEHGDIEAAIKDFKRKVSRDNILTEIGLRLANPKRSERLKIKHRRAMLRRKRTEKRKMDRMKGGRNENS